MLNETQNLALGDRERLFGYLEGSRRVILPEPQSLLTETPRVPGLDGQKMSKSYGNAILLREEPATVTTEDPHDADRSGAGAPHRQGRSRTAARCGRCTRSTRMRRPATGCINGCTTAGIGCLDCKQPVIDAIIARAGADARARAAAISTIPTLVRNIVADGCERARKLAEETMRDVREAMGLDYT